MAEDNDIQIELGDVSYRETEQKRRPDTDRAFSVASYGQPGGESIPVFIHEEALRGIEAHAASDTSVELGGALLGGFYRHGDKQFLEITDFVVATAVEHTSAQITFTHDTWAQIEAERESKQKKSQIVGWYHTHPDLGVFLSEPDVFIQRNFFKEPWQVALVLDPVRGDRGFFQSKNTKLVRLPGFHIVADKSRKKALESYVKEIDFSKRRLEETASGTAKSGSGNSGPWLAILSFLFFAILIGEGIAGRPLLPFHHDNKEKQAMQSMKMGNYEESERLLAQALLDDPKDPKLLRDFSRIRVKAEDQPADPVARQRGFVRWFLSQADEFAARGDYENAQKLYNAAGVSVKDSPEKNAAWTDRDGNVLAAYGYLLDREQITKSSRSSEDTEEEEGTLKMQIDVKRSWDEETVMKIRAGLNSLIKEQPSSSSDYKNALKSLEKEYRLKAKGDQN